MNTDPRNMNLVGAKVFNPNEELHEKASGPMSNQEEWKRLGREVLGEDLILKNEKYAP